MKTYTPSQILRRPLSKRLIQLIPLGVAMCFLTVSTGISLGQITEATTEPPPDARPDPGAPRMPQDSPGNPPMRPVAPPERVGPQTVVDNILPPENVARIQSIDGRKLTIKDRDQAKPYVVTVADEATITLNRKPANLGDLQPNDFVRITKAPENPDIAIQVAAARVVHKTPPAERSRLPQRPRTEGQVDRDRRVSDQQGGLGLVVGDSPNQGIVILDVQRRTPAWEAGIQVGDYLLEFEKKEIVTPDDFLETVRSHEPGDRVRLVLWRNGKTRAGNVELTTREAARDREAEDVRAHIVAETHGDDTVVIKRTPGRTETLDREPEESTVVIDRETDVEQETGESREVPEDYDDLAERYRELQRRVAELERELNQRRE